MSSLSADQMIEKIRAEAARLSGATAPVRVRSGMGRTVPGLVDRQGQAIPAEFPERKQYDAGELIAFPDALFVRAAYLAALGREPDAVGLRHHIDALRHGAVSKREMLRHLRHTEEGDRKGATIVGLEIEERAERLFRLPVIGRILRRLSTFLRLSQIMLEQRRLGAEFEELWVTEREAERDHRAEFAALKVSVAADIANAMSVTTRLTQDVAALQRRASARGPSGTDVTVDERIAEIVRRLDQMSEGLASLGAASRPDGARPGSR